MQHKKRKRDEEEATTTAAAASSSNSDTNAAQNGENISEVPCPLCNTVLATSLRDDNKNLNVGCPSKCKLPWCNTTNEYWSMLANATVNVLDRFKRGRNGKIPKCERGVEASLTLYRHKHIRATVKRANDPKAEKHMELHDNFFSNVVGTLRKTVEQSVIME